MQWSKRSPLSSAQRMSLTVPLIDGPSSSPVTRKLIEPGKAPRTTKRRAAAAAAAIPPFISQAPRPQSAPSATSAANGPNRQRASSPGGTTSVCPAKTKFGAAVPYRAWRLRTSGVPGSEKVTSSAEKPASARRSRSQGSAPASAGVTEGKAIRARAMSSAEGARGISLGSFHSPPLLGKVAAQAVGNARLSTGYGAG